jgi:Tol biopolymer transport system component
VIPANPVNGKIAFASDRDGNDEIYTINPDGSNLTRLTFSGGRSPAWSPDGTKIAFVSDRDGEQDLFVMNASDGSAQTNLTPGVDDGSNPDWSPDGTKIVFISQLGGGDNEVVVTATDGSSPVNLTNNEDTEYDPHWSGDGSRIVYESEHPVDGNLEISVMNADGSGQTNLTNHPEDDSEPSWQPVPVPTRTVTKAKVKEGKTARFRVILATPPAGEFTLDFATVKGTAKPRKDFRPKAGTLTFLPGETTKLVKVKTRRDDKDERNERFFLEVSIAGEVTRGKAVIRDND